MNTKDSLLEQVVPHVSVIMPVVVGNSEFEAAIHSLEKQDYTGEWDLVISLNTTVSTELQRIQEIVEASALPPTNIIVASNGKGAAFARNEGAKATKAPILAFIDSDDVAHTGWLTGLVSGLGLPEERVAVSGYLDETKLGVAGQKDWRPPATPGALPSFMGATYLLSGNMALRSKDFQLVGGFDTELVRCEDIAFSWALVHSGVELKYAPEAIVYYRHRKGLRRLLKQHFMYGRGFSEVLKKYDVPNSPMSKDAGFWKKLKPNSQQVEHFSIIHYARRGAIALGRVYGLLQNRREAS